MQWQLPGFPPSACVRSRPGGPWRPCWTAAVVWLGWLLAASSAARAEEPFEAARQIDRLLADHWRAAGVEPAPASDDRALLRRATLDLAGRVPTAAELRKFLADKSPDKRSRLIAELTAGPEFPLNFGRVLEGWIQGRYQGDEPFLDYLRAGLRQGKSWDVLFREMLVGPWESPAERPANRFLDKRAKDLGAMTSDTARTFFGVDISCAQCHDHPLVDDWTQDHYYGLASFFGRTTGGKGKIAEKSEGEVKFLAADGQERTARMMFLSGRVVEPGGELSGSSKGEQSETSGGSSAPSRRELLVRIALEDDRFFRRAVVNRVWQYLLGRGLVEPVDQMHSANTPAVPELLDWLADDFAAHGYDLRRLVAAVAMSRAYQLSSHWPSEAPLPPADLFAVARLRPLGRQQLAMSLLVATGDQRLDQPAAPQRGRLERVLGVDGLERVERYLELEEQAAELARSFDPAQADFHSSAAEALFVSNAEAFQQLLQPRAGNLVQRLAELKTPREVIEAAFQATLQRLPDDDEFQQLAALFEEPAAGMSSASIERLVWALVASAEFRFNH
ncbi:MAG: DUF1553 domain-containing protein [Pirellulaceae bacterium]|nr:DUF1553 domain-containing protein [Pirellulaceae bacterium]